MKTWPETLKGRRKWKVGGTTSDLEVKL